MALSDYNENLDDQELNQEDAELFADLTDDVSNTDTSIDEALFDPELEIIEDEEKKKKKAKKQIGSKYKFNKPISTKIEIKDVGFNKMPEVSFGEKPEVSLGEKPNIIGKPYVAPIYTPSTSPIKINGAIFENKDASWYESKVRDEDDVRLRLEKQLGKDFEIITPFDPGTNTLQIFSKQTGRSINYSWGVDTTAKEVVPVDLNIPRVEENKKQTFNLGELNDWIFSNSRYNPNKKEANQYKASGLTYDEALEAAGRSRNYWAITKEAVKGALSFDADNRAIHMSNIADLWKEPEKYKTLFPENATENQKVEAVRKISTAVQSDANTLLDQQVLSSDVYKMHGFSGMLKNTEEAQAFYDGLAAKNQKFIYNSGFNDKTIKKFFAKRVQQLATEENNKKNQEIAAEVKLKSIDDNLNFYEPLATATFDSSQKKIYNAWKQVDQLNQSLYKLRNSEGYSTTDTAIANKEGNLQAELAKANALAKKLSADNDKYNHYFYDPSTAKIATVSTKDVNLDQTRTKDITQKVINFSTMYHGMPKEALAKKFVEISSQKLNSDKEGNVKLTVAIKSNTAEGEPILEYLTSKGIETKKDKNGYIVIKNVPLKELSFYTGVNKFHAYDSKNGRLGEPVNGKIETWQNRNSDLAANSSAINNLYLLNQSPTSELTNVFGWFGQGVWGEINKNYVGSRKKADTMASIAKSVGMNLTGKVEKELIPTATEEVATSTGAMLPTVAKIAAVTALTGGVGEAILGEEAIAAFTALSKGTAAEKALYHTAMALKEEGEMRLAGLGPTSGAAFYATGKLLPAAFRPFKESYGRGVNNALNGLLYHPVKGAVQMDFAGLTERAFESINSNAKFKDYLSENYNDFPSWFRKTMGNAISFGFMGSQQLLTKAGRDRAKYSFASGNQINEATNIADKKYAEALQTLNAYKEDNSTDIDKDYNKKIKAYEANVEKSKFDLGTLTNLNIAWQQNEALKTDEGLKDYILKENKSFFDKYYEQYGQTLDVVVSSNPGAKTTFTAPVIDPKTNKVLENGKISINRETAAPDGVFNQGKIAHEFSHAQDWAVNQQKVKEYSETPIKVKDADGIEEERLPNKKEIAIYKDKLDSDKNDRIVKILEKNFPELMNDKIYSGGLNVIEAVEKEYGEVNEDGQLTNKAEVNDEIIKRVIEELAGRTGVDLTSPYKARGFFSGLKADISDLLNKNGKVNYEIKDANELLDLLNKYAQSTHQSEGASFKYSEALSKIDLSEFGDLEAYGVDANDASSVEAYDALQEAKRQAKAIENLPESKESKDLKKDLRDLDDAYENGDEYMDDQEYENKRKNLLFKIAAEEKKKAESLPIKEKTIEDKIETEESIVKDIIKNEKGSISSNKVQDLYNAKGVEAAQDIIDLFKPITNRIVDKRRDAPGFDKELLTDEIETGKGGILDLITKYDPESGIPLAAYINKYLPVRAIATSRRLLESEFKADVTEQKGLIAEEAKSEAAEKPKYKNALESNVFSPEVLKTMSDKIITQLRTLKSRIDESISLNRTVTPLIAEIRDAIGKQLDIDVKKEMGGKKDNELVNWLLKNKRYMLENMTTTWLMGANGQGGIPQAIQKRIDGKWVSYPDWVNQKIDRESVSTDNAGRTSGAELVRRIPNAFNNVSDAVYLGQFIGPDGNPIRGRKESGAKAVAEETAFDVINKDLLEGGPISNALIQNQQRQGVVISEAFNNEFIRQSERGNVKYSKDLLKEMSDKLKENITEDKATKIITGMISQIVAPSISKRKIGIDSIKEKWEEKLGTNLYQKIYDEYLYPIADSLQILQNTEAGQRGNVAEEQVIKTLNDIKNKDFKVVSEKSAGVGSHDIDIKFKFKDADVNLEIKSGKSDRLTSLNIHNYSSNNMDTSRSLSEKNKDDLLSQIKNYKRFNNFVKRIIEVGGTLTKNGSLEVTPKQLNILKRNSSIYKRSLIPLTLDVNLVKDIYKRKNIDYIGFGDIGIFNVGDNKFGLDVPDLEGDLYSRAFLHTGPLKENGKISLTLKVFTQLGTKAGNDLAEKSKNSIYSAESWNNLFKNVSDQKIEYIKNTENFVKTNNLIDATLKSLDLNKEAKGIGVFDFDDTVGLTKSNVLYTMPDGSKGKLTGAEFAKEGSKLAENGAEFDFSEFSKVMHGKPGPMIEKLKKMLGKFGNKDMFILTARPADSAGPIKEFLDSIGINIPIENITGLGNSSSQAKADWMIEKANQGYNDFYFADDHIGNVEAVKNALEVLDVKSKIQQVREQYSKDLSKEFNKIIFQNEGVESFKVFSDITAKRRGANKNKFDFYVPPSAADFELLLYKFLGKGELGEKQKEFFNETLLRPYSVGNDLMDAARQSIKKEYKKLTNAFPEVSSELPKLTPDKEFTYDQAVRVAMWSDSGKEIPGLSKADERRLTDFVNNDPKLKAFKDGLIVMGRQGKGWIEPTDGWEADTIIADLHNITEGAGRKKFLGQFIDNAEQIFGKWENGKMVGPNMNKIEAVYGTNVREALEDSIYRMTNGKNRSYGQDKETSMWSNWVNGSTGTIMFLNTRSAILQLIGSVNFLNFRDNNPYAAAKAFANQKQYWTDFARIWNSDKMKERRGGLKEDVAAAEIANAAANSKNKARSLVSYLLKIGYTPTQIADSFAIASGGAPFYRNRINSYLKEGKSESEAEKLAWLDFTKVSDETQQSGDPRDISKQQASSAGRLLLTFQNTAMQQSRIVKKAFLDLKNGRGDTKTNLSKIAYYIAIQNIMFSGLQAGLFTVFFNNEDEETKKQTTQKKAIEVADGVLDTILRGTGFIGGIIATTKNVIQKYLEESEKKRPDYAEPVFEFANISPPIGSKLKKAYKGLEQANYDKDLIKARGFDLTQNGRVHLSPMYSVIGKEVEAFTNFPMDRLVNKIENVSQATNSQNEAWQRVMVGLGWSPYSVGIKSTAGDLKIKQEAKAERKVEGKIKAADTRRATRDSIENLSDDEYKKYVLKKKAEREARKDSINNLPPEERKKYLEAKEKAKELKAKEKEILKEAKADSIANLSPEEKAKYNKKVAEEKAAKKEERHQKYLEKKKALQDSLAGLSPRERERYKAKKKAERHQYYLEHKDEYAKRRKSKKKKKPSMLDAL
jgi:hypothetical protein